MRARPSLFILFFLALLLSSSPAFSAGDAAPSGEGVSPRCEVAVDKAAGNYSRCLLRADAVFAKKGNEDRLFAQQMRCGDKFGAQVARAQDRFGEDQCTPYLNQIAALTVTYAEGVATEASGTAAPSYLFVQNGAGGTLSKSTLTLTDVSSKTGWFTDRPHREAGQIRTEDFVLAWGDGGESFSDDPPNAEFSCEVGDETVNYVVELMAPSLVGTDLTYAVESVGDQALPTALQCDSDSHLFIDSALGVQRNVGTGSLQAGESSCQSYCGCYKGMERYGRFCLSGTASTPGIPKSLCTRQSEDSCGGAVQGSATRHSCAWNVALFSVGDNSCAMSAPQYQADEDRKARKINHWNQFINNECKSYCGCEGEMEVRIDDSTNEVKLVCQSVRNPLNFEDLQRCTSFSREGQNFCRRQPYCAWHEATQSDQACSWEVIKHPIPGP